MLGKNFQRLYFVLALCISGKAYGNEDYCPFELENHTFNEAQCADGNCRLDINLPKTEGYKLHSVEIEFGTEENYIRSELEYEEFQKFYSSVVSFSTEHSIFSINAIYHKQRCFSLITLKIENRIILDITNEN